MHRPAFRGLDWWRRRSDLETAMVCSQLVDIALVTPVGG